MNSTTEVLQPRRHAWPVRSWLAGLACAVMLAACGGGGGSGGEAVVPPPVAVNAAPVAQPGAAQSVTVGSVVTLDGSASTDADGDPLTYAWTLTTRPAGSGATLAAPAAPRASFTADTAGTYVATLVVSDGKASSVAVAVVITVTPSGAPQIVLSVPEPVADIVRLSLDKVVVGPVTWFVNGQQVGTGDSYTWDTRSLVNGTYLVVARVPSGPDSTYDLRRSVNVLGSLPIEFSTSASGTTGTVSVLVMPKSPHGITRVAAVFDGVPAGSLVAPNACSSRVGCVTPTGLVFDAYRFDVDAAVAGSGSHTMVVTVTDGSGATKTASVAVPISNPPVLLVSTPSDGALVFGALPVSGSASSDKAGAVTVTARLGEQQFLQTTGSAFTATYGISGLAPGSYLLTVRATDSGNLVTQVQRTVYVVSSGSLAYGPALAMPANAQLLAADGSWVLYGIPEGAVRLRDLASGRDVELSGTAAIQYVSGWRLAVGRAYAYGKGTDCVTYCIYQWSGDGTLANLTNPNPFSRTGSAGTGWGIDVHPVARDGYVLWVNDKVADTGSVTSATGRYTVFNIQAGTYTRVGAPAGVAYVGNNSYDFAVTDGVLHFAFWGQTGGEGVLSTFDVFRWRSDTGVSTRITSGGGRAIYTQTDGLRVAWQQSPVGGNANGTFALVSQPVSGGPSTTWSTSATTFQLRDGLLAWVETGAGGARAVKAATMSQTYMLSSLNTSALVAVGGGQVAYAEQGRLYTFDPATGQKRLRVESWAGGPAFITSGSLVFSIGASVYRVPL